MFDKVLTIGFEHPVPAQTDPTLSVTTLPLAWKHCEIISFFFIFGGNEMKRLIFLVILNVCYITKTIQWNSKRLVFEFNAFKILIQKPLNITQMRCPDFAFDITE